MSTDSQEGALFEGDLEWLRSLVALMNSNDLAEVSIADGDRKVKLRKHGADPIVVAPSVPARTIAPADGGAAAETAALAEGLSEVLSPMVGTFYRSASPESDSFVEVGAEVQDVSVLCIIEAMKVMNEIKAECSGVVEEVLVANGEAVEYGQVLFRIRTS